MALDRLIRIDIDKGMRDQDGTFQSDWQELARVWATRRDLDARDVLEEGGQRTEIRRDWRIRWRNDLAGSNIERVRVFDIESGHLFNVERLIEETFRGNARQRWLRIQAVFST